MTQDKINNLEDILLNIEAGEICLVDWVTKKKKRKFYFLKIDLTDFPKLKTVILDAKLSVRIIFNEVEIDLQKYEHFLGAQHLCDSCSKLEILLNAVDNLTDAQVKFLELLNKVSKTLNTIN